MHKLIKQNAVQDDALVRASVSELLPRWRERDIQDVRYLPGGYSNNNFAFSVGNDRYVIRLPRIASPYLNRQREFTWYGDLPTSIAPPIVAYDIASGRMISRWIDGELLVDAWPNFQLDDLVQYLASLHEQLPTCSKNYDVAALLDDYLQDGHGYSVTRPASSNLRSCHNDLNPWNVIVTDHGWVTLDWEFAGTNDPLFDLMCLHQGLELPDDSMSELASKLLAQNAYAADIPKSDAPSLHGKGFEDRIQQNYRNFWLREYGWAAFQLQTGNDRSEIEEQFASSGEKLGLPR